MRNGGNGSVQSGGVCDDARLLVQRTQANAADIKVRRFIEESRLKPMTENQGPTTHNR